MIANSTKPQYSYRQNNALHPPIRTSNNMNLPAKHLKKVNQRIKEAAKQTNRSTDSIRLIAVSKTKPAADIEQVYQAGQYEFGENYLQEAIDKITSLQHLPNIKWHFIGAIQSNKTRPIAELAKALLEDEEVLSLNVEEGKNLSDINFKVIQPDESFNWQYCLLPHIPCLMFLCVCFPG